MRRGAMGFRLHVAFALLAASVLAATSALAAGPVVVNEFTGAKKQTLREHIIEALVGSGTIVLDDAETQVAADSSAEAYVAVAREHEVAAFVDGHTVMKKSGWTLKLTVHNGADGTEIDSVTLGAGWLPGLLKKVDAEAASSLAGPLGKASAPSTEEDAPAKPEPASKPEAPSPASAGLDAMADSRPPPPKQAVPRPPPLELALGAGVFSRDFAYNQDIYQNLHGYKLKAAPSIVLAAGWYPAAHFTGDVPSQFGLVGDYEHSVGVSSAPEGGQGYGSRMSQLSLGARWRAMAGKHEIGISAKYGFQRFELVDDIDPNATVPNSTQVTRDYVPDVKYKYLRPGIDARFVFGIVQLMAGFGYRSVLSTGDVQSSKWFPRATAAALDANLGAGVEVIPGLAIVAVGEFRRYALDMRSEPEDFDESMEIAGGATDQYLSGRLGVQWSWSGGASAGGTAHRSPKSSRVVASVEDRESAQ